MWFTRNKFSGRWRVISLVLVPVLFFSVSAQGNKSGKVRGVVTDSKTGEILPGANVVVLGQPLGTATDTDGVYVLELSPGSYQLQANYLGYKPQTVKIIVHAGETLTQKFKLKIDLLQTQTVVVLGTYTQNRTVVNSPVPVDVLTPRDIKVAGYTSTRKMLRMLIPSFNATETTVNDGSDEVRPATLRGLEPDHVLVLINGKRRYTSALVHVNGSIGRGSVGVDLNAIPSTAIDHIEVLRDGASAQYGSDAIAGVINIILKDREGLDASASFGGYSTTESRGYSKSEGNLPVNNPSFTWDNGAQDVTINDGFSRTLHLGYGFKVNKTGNIYISGEYAKHNPTNRAGLDPRQQYFSLPDGSPDPREKTFNRLNHHWGDAVSEYGGGFVNGKIPINNNLNFYTFGGYTYRTGSAGGFYRRSKDNRNVRAIYPDGFLPTISTKLYDGQVVSGLKGVLGKWNFDLSQSFGGNTFHFGVVNSLNTSLGTASPTSFNAGDLKFFQAVSNLDLIKQYDIGTATPLTFAAGAEFRWEKYKLVPGEPNSYIDGGVPILDGPNAGKPASPGSQVFPGFSPRNAQNETRTNIATYVNLENKITPRWTLGVASRFEHYSDFGSTLSGKFATRYAFSKAFALRGAISNGFRAPALAQEFFSSIATVFIGGDPFEVGTFPVNSSVAKALGAKDLKAEKSTNVSAGMTISGNNFNVTVDGYVIWIRDRVVLTENFRGSGVQAFLAQRGINATGGRYFTNAVDTRTQGVDVTAAYGVQIGQQSSLRLTVAMNFNTNDITNRSEIKTPPEIQAITSIPTLGRVGLGRIEDGQPKDTWNFMGNYTWKSWGLNARVMRYGTYTDFNSNPERDQKFSTVWTTDLELSYKLDKYVTLAAGSNNLFDQYPDKVYKRNSFNGIFEFSSRSPSGFNGRYLYTRLDVTL